MQAEKSTNNSLQNLKPSHSNADLSLSSGFFISELNGTKMPRTKSQLAKSSKVSEEGERAPEINEPPIQAIKQEWHDKFSSSLVEVIKDPIPCGYLIQYCKEQHSDENILFWIAVDGFKRKWKKGKRQNITPGVPLATEASRRASNIRVPPKISGSAVAWSGQSGTAAFSQMAMKPNSEGLYPPKGNTCPMKIESDGILLKRSTGMSDNPLEADSEIREDVREIWHVFVEDNVAPHQISLDAQTYNTIQRTMDNSKLIPATIFDNALELCASSVERDVFPRFKRSPTFERMLNQASWVATTPFSMDVEHLQFPDASEDCDARITRVIRISRNPAAFKLLRHRLARKHCEENYLFLLSSMRYKFMFKQSKLLQPDSTTKDDVEKQAWLIYYQFVRSKAPHEIATTVLQRKQIALFLADPIRDMFDQLQVQLIGPLWQQISSCCQDDELSQLLEATREAGKLPVSTVCVTM